MQVNQLPGRPCELAGCTWGWCPRTRLCVLIPWLGSCGASFCLSPRSGHRSAQALIKPLPTACSPASWAEARHMLKPRVKGRRWGGGGLWRRYGLVTLSLSFVCFDVEAQPFHVTSVCLYLDHFCLLQPKAVCVRLYVFFSFGGSIYASV